MGTTEKKRLSGGERDAKYAAKMKEKDKESWLAKNRENKKNYMNRISEQKQEEMRKKDKERKREKRAAEKRARPAETYKTGAALGKAQSKAMKALPADPQRAQEVVMGLMRIVDKAVGKPKEEVEQIKEKQVLSSNIELRKKITDFFFQPDVSYTCPGKNDYVIVRQKDGSKVKATKYILVLTLSEAHSEFLKSEPGCQVSLDIFTKLRPANVLLRHSLPKNVCVCIYHANINFIITSLHKQFRRFPSNHRELILLTTCSAENVQNGECQTGACAQCAQLGTVEQLLGGLGVSEDLAKDLHANYLCWEKENDHENKERLRKVEKRHVTLYDMILQLHKELKPFKVHVLVKQHQEVEFNRLRTCDIDTNLLLQFDFSENAEIQEQDEVQTAHWWHLQVSLFTACAWVQGQSSSFVVVTDYMHHDKYMSMIATIKILKELIIKYPTVNTLHLFSDGAAQHFKQRFFFNGVTMLPTILGKEQLKITYDFSATSHGKGAVDGIGGSAKRGVMAKVLSRQEIVKTAADFALTGAAACPGIRFIHVSKEEVEDYMADLDDIAFVGARHLAGIRNVHHVEVKQNFNNFSQSLSLKISLFKFRR